MTNVIEFRGAFKRQVEAALADTEILRQTRRLVDESWQLRAESAAVRRRYAERQVRIEALLQRIGADAELT